MPKVLSQTEIDQRLVRLRNLEKLHTKDQVIKRQLRQQVKDLQQQLEAQEAHFEKIAEDQAVRIAELEKMVFGSKPKGGSGLTPASHIDTAVKKKAKRSKDSYRRPIPPASAITAEERYTIDSCSHCSNALGDKIEAVRYCEDIILPALDQSTSLKTVTKQIIERGWCSTCGNYQSAKDLRGQEVTLGPNIRTLVVYLCTQADQTYSQTQGLINQLYGIYITSSEITNILQKYSNKLLPKYQKLLDRVRAGPAHLDETSWPIQSEQGAGYAWVMASATNDNVVFRLADSRGKSHAQDLVGENYTGVGISDRYGAYKNLFANGKHQICWAHLQRTARDLTKLECLPKAKLTHVQSFYGQLASVYAEIRKFQLEPFDVATRERQAQESWIKLEKLCQPDSLDPTKLAKLKKGILDYQDSLFVCLTVDGTPADNNKAERSLRKLVIKRKKSFGAKTLKGAKTNEILLSVCQSLYNKSPDTFLRELHSL